MKLTAIVSSAIAAVGLAACGSTAVTPPTARPTLSLAAAPTVASTRTASPSPTASPSASPSPCVVTTEGPPGTGSCETPPVVTVTACDSGYGFAAGGGEISWSGADAADEFTIFQAVNGNITIYPGAADPSNPTPASGTYGPLPAGYYTYQFSDNTNEFGGPFSGSFTILNCPVVPTPTPSASPSASPSPTACVPNPERGYTGSCETPPVVTVTACDSGGHGSASGGAISWSGADAADEFTLFLPDGGGSIQLYPGIVDPSNPTPASGSYGPLTAGAYTYQFVDNTDEIFNGSFTILTCDVPNASTDTFPHA